MRASNIAGVGLALCVAFALAGCGAQAGDYSERQFASAKELAQTVEQLAGWTCSESDLDDKAHTDDHLYEYGFWSVGCNNGAVTIYASDARRTDLASKPWNQLESGECRIDGGNWSVSGQQYIVETAHKAMQGTLTCA